MDIPKDKTWLPGDAQCAGCGGHGCVPCDRRGWVPPMSLYARHCERRGCANLIAPDHVAVYCSAECAVADA